MNPGIRPDRARIRRMLRLLDGAFGGRQWVRHGPALDELIRTILSQNTNDLNSGRAFAALKGRFKRWDEVADAPTRRIESAIAVAGLSHIKAVRIRDILRRIRSERGEYSLEFLSDVATDDAMDYLTRMSGVGAKTAACVLLFSFGRPAFPVDTHIFRVAGRLSLIPPRADRVKAQALLQRIVPSDVVYPFHMLLIELGRKVCHPSKAEHSTCPLRMLCPSAGIASDA